MTLRIMLKAVFLSLVLVVSVPKSWAGDTITNSQPLAATPSVLPPLSLDSWWDGPSMTYDCFTLGKDMRDNGVYHTPR